MNRIVSQLRICKTQNRPALIAYITGGDPAPELSVEISKTIIDAGADVLEVGIPFSDPLADGEANQLAAERAINAGTTVDTVLNMIKNLRKEFDSVPIVLFTYLNPIAFSKKITFDNFCRNAADSGVDAILCLDITPEEDKSIEYSKTLQKYNLGKVSLVSPNTEKKRIKLLANFATSFIYYVSREGVTGESKNFSANFAHKIALIRKYSDLPVVVGFGISTPEHVRLAASTGVDGVVVGSAIVRKIEALSERNCTLNDIHKFVSELKTGVYLNG